MLPQKRLGVEVLVDNPIVHCVVEYSAHSLNRCEVGHDGKTAGQQGPRRGGLWGGRPLEGEDGGGLAGQFRVGIKGWCVSRGQG